MKIKTKEFKNKTCCGDHYLYQLNGWSKDDWICADCFLNDLIEGDYNIKTKLDNNKRR